MSNVDGIVLYDSTKDITKEGQFSGSIITKLKDDKKSVIFADFMTISQTDGITFDNGLKVGFEINGTKMSAFSHKISNYSIRDFNLIDYSVQIPDEIMQLYDEGQFSDAFPFTINMLHTAGLYLDDYQYGINHLDFFRGEILKNPISLIMHGIIIADRVVIDHHGDPVFYDCLIVGRDERDNLNVSYEPLTNVDDKVVESIIIVGIEELKI